MPSARNSRHRQRLAEHKLHAEIGDTGQRRLRARLLKPGGRPGPVALGAKEFFDLPLEDRISQQALELVPGNGLKRHPGIVGQLPEFGVESLPHFIGGMAPRPVQVQRQFSERLNPLDLSGH